MATKKTSKTKEVTTKKVTSTQKVAEFEKPKPKPKPKPFKVLPPSYEIPKVIGIPISELPVGTRFTYQGQLYRKAMKLTPGKEVGQKLVKHQQSETLIAGTSVAFDSNTIVEIK